MEAFSCARFWHLFDILSWNYDYIFHIEALDIQRMQWRECASEWLHVFKWNISFANMKEILRKLESLRLFWLLALCMMMYRYSHCLDVFKKTSEVWPYSHPRCRWPYDSIWAHWGPWYGSSASLVSNQYILGYLRLWFWEQYLQHGRCRDVKTIPDWVIKSWIFGQISTWKSFSQITLVRDV